jgi:hypothetical protein
LGLPFAVREKLRKELGEVSTTIGSPVAAWVDRLEAADAMYRYGVAIDSFDDDAVRASFDEEATAQYGKNTDVLNVVQADVDGDHGKLIVYHTSHQVFDSAPDTVNVIVARYHNEVRRRDGVFRLSKLYMEVLWAERRQDPSGYLDAIGGNAAIWTR